MAIYRYPELPLLAIEAVEVFPYLEKKYYNDVKYALEWITVEEAKKRCMSFAELKENYKNFEEYHEQYLRNGDVPCHEEQYPVFENVEDDYEWLIDGWHRFHSYVRDGFASIPVMRILISK